jgi:hypothetical protein
MEQNKQKNADTGTDFFHSIPLLSNHFLTNFLFHYSLMHNLANGNCCFWLKQEGRKSKEAI